MKSALFSRIVGIGLFGALVTSACDDNPKTEISPPRTAESFPAAYATAICDYASRCADVAMRSGNDDGSYLVHLSRVSPASCAAAVDRTLGSAFPVGARATYDPSKAATCLGDFAASACNAEMTAFAGSAFGPESCRAVFEGQAALGEACSLSGECAGVAYCDAWMSTCPGVCVQDDPPELQPLFDPWYQGALATEGQACGEGSAPDGSENVRCAAGFLCVRGGEGSVCRSMQSLIAFDVGAACVEGFVFNAAELPSDGRKFCDPTTLVCSEGACRPNGGAIGAPCVLGDGSWDPCQDAGGYCGGDDLVGTCTSRAANGASCWRDTMCQSGFCSYDSGVCEDAVCE